MILADTHAWLWWLSDRDALSPAARAALSSNSIAVSSITFWEVATLVRKGRVELAQPAAEWLSTAVERSGTTVIDLTMAIAVTAGAFADEMHGDPADRIIVATAVLHGVPLVTKDHKIADSGLVRTIW